MSIDPSALSEVLRVPELQQSPGAAVALASSGTQTPTADAQAVGYTQQVQAYGKASNEYTQTQGHPPAHHQGILAQVGSWLLPSAHRVQQVAGAVGTIAHDVRNDVINPIERQTIPGTSIRPAGPVLKAGLNLMPELGSAAQQALAIANMPLQQVQHNYRYLHDVWVRHGPAPALGELATMIGAGYAVGQTTDSPQAGVLAGEAVGQLEGRLLYPDSWARTASGTYRDPHTGQLVSPGRDVANALTAVGVPVGKAGAAHGIVSGAFDAAFDYLLDPLQNAGTIYGEAKIAPAHAPGDAQALLDSHLPKPDVIQYHRAVNWIAGEDSAAAIGSRFKGLSEIPGMLNRLAEADTPQAVTNVFEDQLAFEKAVNEGRFTPLQILNPITNTTTVLPRPAYNPISGEVQTLEQGIAPVFAQGLPTLSSFKAMLDSSQEWLQNASQRARAFSMVPEQAKVAAVGDTGVEALRRQGLMGMGPSLTNDLIDRFLATNDIGERRNIVKSLQKAVLLSRAGIRDEAMADPSVMQKALSLIDEKMGGEIASTGVYDTNTAGQDISRVELHDAAGNVVGSTPAAGHSGQLATEFGLLDYGDVKDLSQQLKNATGLFGKVDDFAWDHFTSTWRKLALLTGGFAAHITMAEDLLNGARLGFTDVVDNGIKAAVSDLGFKVAREDVGPIRAAVYHLMGSPSADQWDAILGKEAQAHAAELRTLGMHEEARNVLEEASKVRAAALDKADLATRVTLLTDGHSLVPAVSAGYVFPTSGEAPVETARTAIEGRIKLGPFQQVGPTYRLYSADDKNASIWWGQHLNMLSHDAVDQVGAAAYRGSLMNGEDEQVAATKAYQAMRDKIVAMPQSEKAMYTRLTDPGDGGITPEEAFARHKVEALKGATVGKDGNPHLDLLGKIATGDTITWRDVKDIIPEQMPMSIPGREIDFNPLGGIDRLAELGHQKVLTPIINSFARRPIFMAQVEDSYKAYEVAVEAGTLDKGVATAKAVEDASTKMIRFIHNPNERLQLTETMRNVAPFWFAQVQAYKRFGRLLLEDPGAFRRMQLILTALTDFSNRQIAAGGNQQVVYPGSGFVTHGMLAALTTLGAKGMDFTTAVPVAFAGSVNSMSAVDPFMSGASGLRPSLGPLVAVSAHIIDGFDPHAASVVASAVGQQTAAGSWWDLIPNTPLRDAIMGAAPELPGLVVGNDSIWMHTLANLDYAQNVAMDKWKATDQYKSFVASGGDPNDPNAPGRPQIVPSPEASPAVRQGFVDSVKSQSRWVRFIQAAMSEVTPASPQALIGNQKIPAEFQQMVKKSGLNQAYVDFAQKYPDGAPLVQSMSSVAGSGVLAASKETQAWIDKNLSFVNAHKDIASFFVPQNLSDTYSPAAYNEQVAMGLRTRKTPQEFQNDYYVNAGWADYDRNRNIYESMLRDAGAQQLSPPTPTSPGTYSPTGQTTVNSAWDNWLTIFEAQHPAWTAAFNDPNTQIVAQQAYNELRTVLASGQHPATPQTDVIKFVMQQYDNYVSQLVPGTNGLISTTSSINDPNTRAWQAWLKDEALQHPETAPVINKVFRWLTPKLPPTQAGGNG